MARVGPQRHKKNSWKQYSCTFYSISVFKTKLLQTKESTDDRLIMAFGSKETGILFLRKDGTQAPKHVGEIRLMYVLLRICPFSWYN